ncbi:MAG: SDR family oxidoreductase [Candidatus Omnitrophota bacterium]
MINRKKIILITGGSRGIGSEIAKTIANKERIIYINYYKNRTKAEQTASVINKKGFSAKIIQADVSNEKDVKMMINSIIKESKYIDVLINNATPTLSQKNFFNLSWKDFQKQLDVLVKGAFYCSNKASEVMKQQKSGHIVTLLSSCVFGLPPANLAHYVIAKYGLMGLCKSMAVELVRFGIRVNMVSPFITVGTDLTAKLFPERLLEIIQQQHPLKRLATIKDTAEIVNFLISEKASYLNSVNIPITGGVVG